MELNAMYSEQDMYQKNITRMIKDAGLFPDPESEASFEEYLQASAALGRVL